jgi:hypothetical protein
MTSVGEAGPVDAAPRRIACPRCGGTLGVGDGATRCASCGKTATVVRFEPIVEAFSTGAAGRCAHHPNKDAVAGCARCGAFVCEVCVTRTGEATYCPACFETLHERDDLDTTRARRTRIDYLILHMGMLCWMLGPCVFATAPLTLALGGWALAQRRRRPWLSTARIVGGMALSLPGVALWIFIFASRAKR